MLGALTLILVFQLAGELLHQGLGIPVPGAVMGMLMLLVSLFLHHRLIQVVRPTSGVVLSNLSLFFIPPAVGIMGYASQLMQEGLRIAVVIIVSSALGIVATALTTQKLILWQAKRRHKEA